MKLISLLFFLMIFPVQANTACKKAFAEQATHPQFIETLLRYFSIGKSLRQQKAFESDLKSFVTTDKTRGEILRYLIQKKYITVTAENSFALPNPLFDSIINNSAEHTIALIKEKPNSLYEGALLNFLPPFFLMVQIGNQKTVLKALKIDPSLVHSKNKIKEAPLHLAIDREIAEILLHYKADPNLQDQRGKTALHNSRDPETVKLLLKHNADIKIRDRSGLSVLKYHTDFIKNNQIINVLNQFKENERKKRVYKSHVVHVKSLKNALSETDNSLETKDSRKNISKRKKEELRSKKQQKNEERKRVDQGKKDIKRIEDHKRNISSLRTKKLSKKERKEQRKKKQQELNLLQELKLLKKSEQKAMSRIKILKSKLVFKLFSLFNRERKRKALENKQRDILKDILKDISKVNNQLKVIQDAD